jgi:hypothetical protein
VSGVPKVELTIYAYSDTIMSSSSMWDRFNKDCILPVVSDRSDASSEEIIQLLIERLKNRWSNIFRSESINWRIWATTVSRLRAHEQEQAIKSPPPDNLIHLFRHVPENLEQRHAAVTRGFGIANRVAENTINDLLIVKEDLSELIQFTNQLVDAQKVVFERVSGILNTLNIQRDLVRDAELAMVAEETPETRAIAESVPDQDDIDHMNF